MHDCGLAHLDLKLDNIKVRMCQDGSDLHLTILDLGSAQPHSIRKLSLLFFVKGKLFLRLSSSYASGLCPAIFEIDADGVNRACAHLPIQVAERICMRS